MEIQIRREGKLSTVDLDLDLDSFSNQENRRIDEVMGTEDREPSSMLLGAMVWAKLVHTPFADVKFEEMDFDQSELLSFAETPDELAWVAAGDSVVIPMETATGTVDAEVSLG